MKNFFSTLILAFAVLFTFTGCQNFFQGAGFLEKLEDAVAYVNAPETTIYIMADDAKQGTTYPNGPVKYKVDPNGKNSISFKVSTEYVFKHWEVVKKDTFAAVTDIIDIEDSEAAETTFTYKAVTSDTLLIRPVCAIRPAISSQVPLENSENTRDTSIVITFSENLSEENVLDAIEITSGGISVKEYYLDPVLNGNTITIAANLSNLIAVQSGKTKTINVTIPDTFFYEKDGSQIPLASGTKWSFKVNSNTSQQAELTFSISESQGSVTPSSTNKYNIGDTIALSFEPKDGIRFLNWKVLDGEGNEPSDSVLLIEDKKAAATTITVLNNVKGVSITPVTEIIPGVTGSVIPAFVEAGVAAHSRIAVNFVTPMNSEDLKDFKNISITCNNTSITSKFMLPELSSDGKILTIKPKAGELEKLVTGTVAEITVTLHKEIRSLQETEACLPEDYSWTYRINKDNTDVIPPELNSVSLKMNDINGKDLLTTACISWTDDDYKQNHIKDTVFITCTGSDADSGVKTVKVTETLIYSPDGTAKNKVVTNNSNSYGVFLEKEPGIFSADFEYKLHSAEDGIIQLDFVLYDNASLASSSKTVYVIKDTAIPQSYTIKNSFDGNNLDNYERQKNFTVNFVKSNIWATNINTSNKLDSEFSYSFKYGTTRDSLSNGDFKESNSDNDNTILNFYIEPDFSKNTILQFTMEDEVGNSVLTERFIPHTVSPLYPDTNNVPYAVYQSFLNDTGLSYESVGSSQYSPITSSNLGRKVYGINMDTGETIYTIYGPAYDNTSYSSLETPIVTTTDEIIKGPDNSGVNFFTVKVTNRDSSAEYYFKILDSQSNSYFYKLTFDSNNNARVPIESKKTYASNGNVLVVKGANNKLSSNVQLPDITTNAAYDTLRPVATITASYFVNSSIREMFSYDGNYFIAPGFYDRNSGLRSATVDGKNYVPLEMHYIDYDPEICNKSLRNRVEHETLQQNLHAALNNASYNNKTVKAFRSYSRGTNNAKDTNNYFYIPPKIIEKENSNCAVPKTEYFSSAIPIKDIEEGSTIICDFICYDNAGNASSSNYINWNGTISTLKQIPVITVDTSNSTATITIPEETPPLSTENMCYSAVVQTIEPLDSSKKDYEWVTCRTFNTYYNNFGSNFVSSSFLSDDNTYLTYSESDKKFTRSFTMTEETTNSIINWKKFNNSFIKVNIVASKYRYDYYRKITISPSYSYPVYLYTGDNVCNSKNWQEVNGKIQISHDKPCFVQTVCSAKDRGDDNYYEWERRGEKLNKQYFYTTSWKLSDYEPRLDDIPAGDYYRYIIHYADGSYQMTPTRRK